MKVDILAIGVHPDDIELSCSGTLLKHLKMGYSVGLLDLTQGELGTRGTAELRLKEAKDAADRMGASFRINLKMPDGFFKIGQSNLTKIIEVIRYCQPKIVLANALSDRHPDHPRASNLVYEACFLSGLPKVQTTFEEVSQSAHRPELLLHYIQDHHLKPDVLIDISEFMDEKIELVKCFKSQFFDPDNKLSPTTPISGEDFFNFLKARAKDMGRPIKAEFAEGFQSRKLLGVNDLFSLK